MTETAPCRDTGVQPERTALAWTRTGLAVVGNAILVLRSAVEHSSVTIAAAGVGLLVAALCIVVRGARRRAQLAEGAFTAELAVFSPWLVMAVALLTSLTGAVVIAVEGLIP